MTEVQLQIRGVKNNIRGWGLSIIITILGSTIWWSFKAGTYFNKLEDTRKVTEENRIDISNMKTNMYGFEIIQAGHTFQIEELKKQKK